MIREDIKEGIRRLVADVVDELVDCDVTPLLILGVENGMLHLFPLADVPNAQVRDLLQSALETEWLDG